MGGRRVRSGGMDCKARVEDWTGASGSKETTATSTLEAGSAAAVAKQAMPPLPCSQTSIWA